VENDVGGLRGHATCLLRGCELLLQTVAELLQRGIARVLLFYLYLFVCARGRGGCERCV
jgi:hypothetical protein